VITRPTQVSFEPELSVGEEVQLGIGEEVAAVSIGPVGRDDVTREDSWCPQRACR
jgi:hypothetical protein